MNIGLMVAVMSRIISSSTLITAVPETAERGAFMSVNSSVQQVSGGIASVIAGLIVKQTSDGRLLHYDTLGYIVAVSVIFTIFMMRSINAYVRRKNEARTISMTVPGHNLMMPEADKMVADI